MMKVCCLKIRGFRALFDIEIPLSDYTILIGRNNSGKSSVLLALKLLFEGTARDLTENDFSIQDDQRADQIIIEATLEGINKYLILCDERHRTKIESCVEGDKLRIRRVVKLESSKPELGKLELWQPDKNDFGLLTGIDSALKQLLPEVIFIEAFKDPSEEAQAKSSATLGKLLKQIVEHVAMGVGTNVKKNLDRIERYLNEDRKPEVLRRIEQQIRQHMRVVFEEADIRLRFRLPEVSDLMGLATVELKDRGPWTPIEGKGQGFQRVLYLALLRALAEELRQEHQAEVRRPFLLLFEEPEAFLHPALQRQMGDVLESISESNQVVIATHSPLLVTPQRIRNILILRQDTTGLARPIVPNLESLRDPDDKQLARLLEFSSSSEFLFADCVLVVEGLSDRALFEASWNALRKSLSFGRQSVTLAIIDAGSKSVVPVWVKYLNEIGISAYGVVDLDFLWDGAGKCLGSDPQLSKFTEKFWNLAAERGISEMNDGKFHIIRDKKKSAFRLVRKNFGQEYRDLRQRLQQHHRIWVLSRGEIEIYFGLSDSSKGKYSAVSQEIRRGKIKVPREIKEVLKWAVGL